MAEQTLNVPQLVVFLLITALAVRWYVSRAPAANGPQPNAPQRGGARYTAAHIDQVAQMFPQLDRRHIAWDLHRNGGNVAATTERMLTGRGLDVPPPTFSPQLPRPSPSPRASAPTSKPSQPDLITRYNLSSKLQAAAATSPASPENTPQKQKSWSADRNERQANLQRRREEMILAARRKLEEKQRAQASGSSA